MLRAEDNAVNSHAFCVLTRLASLIYYHMACIRHTLVFTTCYHYRDEFKAFLFAGLTVSELCFASFLPCRGILHLYICPCTALSGLCRHLSIDLLD